MRQRCSLVFAVLAGLTLLAPAVASAAPAELWFAHVILGERFRPLDVYLDGRLLTRALPSVGTKGPLAVVPGVHELALVRPGTDSATGPVFSLRRRLLRDERYLLLVRLTEGKQQVAELRRISDDAPGASPITTLVRPSNAVLTIVHGAASPPVIFNQEGGGLLPVLANGEQVRLRVTAPIELRLFPSFAGSRQTIFGDAPVAVPLHPGEQVLLFVYGATDDRGFVMSQFVIPPREP